MIKVYLFARSAEVIGRNEIIVEQSEITVTQLKEWLVQHYPQLESELPKALVAVNQEFAEESTIVTSKDEVAIIPPVSGG